MLEELALLRVPAPALLKSFFFHFLVQQSFLLFADRIYLGPVLSRRFVDFHPSLDLLFGSAYLVDVSPNAEILESVNLLGLLKKQKCLWDRRG